MAHVATLRSLIKPFPALQATKSFADGAQPSDSALRCLRSRLPRKKSEGLAWERKESEVHVLAEIVPRVAVRLARHPQARARRFPLTKLGHAVVSRGVLDFVVRCSVRAWAAREQCKASPDRRVTLQNGIQTQHCRAPRRAKLSRAAPRFAWRDTLVAPWRPH